jgi:hypothetical protein
MTPQQTYHHPLHSCIAEIERFRANMKMLKEAIRQERDDLLKLERTLPPPGHPDHESHKARIEKLARQFADHEVLLPRVEAELEKLLEECREKRAEGESAPANLDKSLRRAIDDPPYWRDGDPALAKFVSDRFKQLYPDDSGY